jgi:tetratricopeptide (TPR) repeat protein
MLLYATPESRGQWDLGPEIDRRIQQGIDHIYNLEFYDAEKLFAEVIRLRPEHPSGHFFRAMIQWWRILSNLEDESGDDRFDEMLEEVIDMCDVMLERNPNDITALFFKGGSLGFRGRLRGNRGNWFGAARDGLSALPIVRLAHELDPENNDVLLGMGIYHYYADVVPSEYPIVKPFMVFFPSGDRKKGLEELELASQKAKYASVEATYFLVQNYFLFEKNFAKAHQLALQLNKRYPQNPLFLRYVGRSSVSLGMWGDVLRVFSEIATRATEKQTGFNATEAREAYYYLGKYFFTVKKYDESLTNFLRCVELSLELDKEGASGFLSMATLQIGMIHDLQKRRQEALTKYRAVLKMKAFENTHRDAGMYLEKPYKGQNQ